MRAGERGNGKGFKTFIKKRLFDPLITLWVFLSQVLDTDKTCHNAVSKIIAHLAGEEVEIPSTDTSAYCQAKAGLPEKLLEKLFNCSAQNLEAKVTQEHLWCGRNVKVIDGNYFHARYRREPKTIPKSLVPKKRDVDFQLPKLG